MQPTSYRATQEAIGLNEESAIAVNERNGTLCLMKLKKEGFFLPRIVIDNYWICKGSDILAAELIDVDSGVTITKTDRSSQVAGAIIGGVLLGGVGVLVGGVTGKKESHQAPGYTKLKITVNDLRNPVHVLYLGNKNNEHWHGIVSVLIKRSNDSNEKQRFDAQVENKSQKELVPSNTGFSVAEELTKLAKLVEQGFLTKIEFAEQKKKLLSQSKLISASSRIPDRVPAPSLTNSQAKPFGGNSEKSTPNEVAYPSDDDEYLSFLAELVERGDMTPDELEDERRLVEELRESTEGNPQAKLSSPPPLPPAIKKATTKPISTKKRILSDKRISDIEISSSVTLNDPELLAKQLRSGLNPNITIERGLLHPIPLLHCAALDAPPDVKFEIIKLLIEHGADPRARWHSQNVLECLNEGPKKPERRLVQLLNSAGLKPAAKPRKKPKAAPDTTSKSVELKLPTAPDTITTIGDALATQDPFLSARSPESLSKLLASGTSPNTRSNHGEGDLMPLLHYVVLELDDSKTRQQCLKLLLDHGADVNIRWKNRTVVDCLDDCRIKPDYGLLILLKSAGATYSPP